MHVQVKLSNPDSLGQNSRLMHVQVKVRLSEFQSFRHCAKYLRAQRYTKMATCPANSTLLLLLFMSCLSHRQTDLTKLLSALGISQVVNDTIIAAKQYHAAPSPCWQSWSLYMSCEGCSTSAILFLDAGQVPVNVTLDTTMLFPEILTPGTAWLLAVALLFLLLAGSWQGSCRDRSSHPPWLKIYYTSVLMKVSCEFVFFFLK